MFQRARDVHFARLEVLGEVHHSWQCSDTFPPLITTLTFQTSIVPHDRKSARVITPRERVPSFSFDGPVYMKRPSSSLRFRTAARSQLAWRQAVRSTLSLHYKHVIFRWTSVQARIINATLTVGREHRRGTVTGCWIDSAFTHEHDSHS